MDYNERCELINNLNKAKVYFMERSDDYNRLISIEDQITEKINKINIYGRLKPTRVLGILVGFFLSLPTAIFISQIAIAMRVVIHTGSLLLVSFGFGLIGVPIIHSRLYYLHQNKQVENLNHEIQALDGQKKILIEKLNNYFQQFDLKGVIPFSSSYPASIDILIDYITSHRANSVSEAINLYLDDLHKQRLEDSQKQIIKATKQNVAATQRAGNWAAAATVFSLLNLFQGKE